MRSELSVGSVAQPSLLEKLSTDEWSARGLLKSDGLLGKALADVVDGAGYVTVGRKPAGGGWLPACHADPRVYGFLEALGAKLLFIPQ